MLKAIFMEKVSFFKAAFNMEYSPQVILAQNPELDNWDLLDE
jgi:hypothetical protein